MSTRATIYYKKGLHIFEECMTNEVCIEISGVYSDDNGGLVKSKFNEKYEDFVIDKEDIPLVIEALQKHLDWKKG